MKFTTKLFLACALLSSSCSVLAMDGERSKKTLAMEIWLNSLTDEYQGFNKNDREEINALIQKYQKLILAKESVMVDDKDKANDQLKRLSCAAVEKREKEIKNSRWYEGIYGCASLLSLSIGFCLGMYLDSNKYSTVKVFGTIGGGIVVAMGSLYKSISHRTQKETLNEPFEQMKTIKDKLYSMSGGQAENGAEKD